MVKKIVIVCFLFFLSLSTYADGCFAKVELDRRSVYVQQPFKVTITVLTSTWYTAPLDFDNIQIPNAFVIPFSRTQSGMFDVNGTQYAGLQFYFIVFPYKAGNFTIPEIQIKATTPPPNESVSRQITLKTQPQNFVVKPLSGKMGDGDWFVAKDVQISQSWNKPLNKLKAGDVLERTITINARGTLPQFIPALPTEKLDWAAVYPDEAQLTDTRDDYDANGRTTQTITYLLEKEGDFVMPAIEIKWWNPYTMKSYTRSTGTTRIHVAVNPNLGILATLKDSLNTSHVPVTNKATAKQTLLIAGIPWYWFCLYALTGIFVFVAIIRLLIKFYHFIQYKRAAYLDSEAYAFHQLQSAAAPTSLFLNKLYNWWGKFPINDKQASIGATLRSGNEGILNKEIDSYFSNSYGQGTNNDVHDIKKELRHYRRKKQSEHNTNSDKDFPARQSPWE